MSAFTWGDAVCVRAGAEAAARPGAEASVCGVREVQDSIVAARHGIRVGDSLYLIEFADGSAVEVPEHWLSKIEDSDSRETE